MKLPSEIKTKHKIRDMAIIKLYLENNLTQMEIALRFGLTASRVNQLLYANNHLIRWERNREKAVRVNTLKRMLDKHPENLGKKSTLDIVEQLRKEIEGDKPEINNSTHYHFVTIKEAIENASINGAKARDRVFENTESSRELAE